MRVTTDQVLDGLAAFMITLFASIQTLLTTPDVDTIADVNEAAWISAIIGAILAAIKTVQSRRHTPRERKTK